MTFGSSCCLPPGPDSLPESGSTSTVPRRKRLAGLSLVGVTAALFITAASSVNEGAETYALNVASVNRHVVEAGEAGNDHPIAPVNRYYAKDLPKRQYDPEKLTMPENLRAIDRSMPALRAPATPDQAADHDSSLGTRPVEAFHHPGDGRFHQAAR